MKEFCMNKDFKKDRVRIEEEMIQAEEEIKAQVVRDTEIDMTIGKEAEIKVEVEKEEESIIMMIIEEEEVQVEIEIEDIEEEIIISILIHIIGAIMMNIMIQEEIKNMMIIIILENQTEIIIGIEMKEMVVIEDLDITRNNFWIFFVNYFM